MTAPRPWCALTSAPNGARATASITPRRWPPPTTTASSCASVAPIGRRPREIVRKRVHGTHGEGVVARAERDLAAPLEVPPAPYLVLARTQRKVARDGLISFEGRRYAIALLLNERIRRNAGELRLHGIAESPDALVERAESSTFRPELDPKRSPSCAACASSSARSRP
jgi:hypothetical protein